MGYSGNLFLPNHILYEKDKKIILRDESWHNFRQDFIKNELLSYCFNEKHINDKVGAGPEKINLK